MEHLHSPFGHLLKYTLRTPVRVIWPVKQKHAGKASQLWLPFNSLMSHFHQGEHLPITVISKRSPSAWQSNSHQQPLLNVGSFLHNKAEPKFTLVLLDHPQSLCGKSFPCGYQKNCIGEHGILEEKQ